MRVNFWPSARVVVVSTCRSALRAEEAATRQIVPSSRGLTRLLMINTIVIKLLKLSNTCNNILLSRYGHCVELIGKTGTTLINLI